MSLNEMGWSPYFNNLLSQIDNQGYSVGRIISRHTAMYTIQTAKQEYLGEVSGRLYHEAQKTNFLPVVGDWVLISATPGSVETGMEKAIIHHILDRKTSVSRGAAGTAGKGEGKGLQKEQVIAANIDTLFIVAGMDREYNLRRIERYLTMAYNSGAAPAIILNKADLRSNMAECMADVDSIAFDVPVYAVSAKENIGMDEIKRHIPTGQTAAFMGSSGVGKSSIINRLLGYERQRTKEISTAVNKGVHTTTHRELIRLEGRGMVIDNPGMRELSLWATDNAVENLFQDIEDQAQKCRFNDCQHESEPGCAVNQAIEAGEIDPNRLVSYQKLKKEETFFQQRQNKSTDAIEKDKWRKIKMQYRQTKKSPIP